MRVTCVRLEQPDNSGRSCLLAYVDVELDGMLVIKRMKLIQHNDGYLFLDFPSKPSVSRDRCPGCNRRLDCTANFCPACGHEKAERDEEVHYINVVHPINNAGRRMIHEAVVAEYVRRKSANQVPAAQPITPKEEVAS